MVDSLWGNEFKIEDTKAKIKDYENIDICFMVYEQPTNPCSEREVVTRYLKDSGIEIKEYIPDLVDKHILF